MINNYKQKIRTALAAICLFASFSSVMAQVPSRYNLSISSGTYTPLTVAGGATELPAVITDDANANLTGLPGFAVDGVTYTNYQVNSNGRIVLYSTTAPTTQGTYTPLSSAITGAGVVIAPFGRDLNNQTGTNCLYQVVGNNIIFDYQNYRRFNVTGESLNFQVILNTVNGSIQFVYGTMTPSNNTSYPQIGFRTTTSFPNNVNNILLDIAGSPATCNWSNVVTGAANNSTVYFNSANPGVGPSNGLTYTWTPQNVVDRVSTFSAVSAITTDGASIGWTAPTGATQYNVQYRAVGSCNWTNWSGNPVAATTLALTGLSPLTTYQVRVQSSDGTNAPIYSQIFNAAGTGSGYNATGSFTTLAAGCAGTPTAGVTSGPAGACSGVNFSLSLTGAVTGDAGLTFQWQSSPNGTTFTDISGATSATYTANQTASTFYQCVITCANGGATSTSTPLQVNMNSFLFCHCNVNFPSGVEPITLVNIGTINNPSTDVVGGPSLQDFTSLSTDLALGSTNPITVKGNTGGNYTNFIRAFIDWNQDGDFLDANETYTLPNIVNSTGIDAISSVGSIVVPMTATLGITKMRIVKKYNSAPISCEAAGFGQAEDYLVNVICPTMVAPAVTGGAACAGNAVNLSATATFAGATLTWYNAAVAGTVVNTGATFTTPILVANTSYWVSETITGCTESPLAEVIATISPVDAVLGAVNVTCNGLGNGSFTVDNIICGQIPFTFSVNGGPFGAIPTNLVPGTYSVVIEDANTLQSAPISVVITEPSFTINNPIGVNDAICLNETSAVLNATSTLSTSSAMSQVVTFDLTAQPTEVGGNSSFPAIATNPNIISTATVTALPANATITSVTFTMPGLVPQGGSYGNDVGFGFTGSVNANYAAGVGAPASATAFSYTRTLPVGSININGGVVNLNYYDLYNDVTAGAECIFPIGTAVGTLTINYSVPNPANITWWDAATGGTQIGTGNTLESIGTSVLVDGSTAGVYNFFAQGEIAGCTSPSRTLVTTTVNALPAVTVTSNDADNTVCENTSITLTGAGAATYAYTGGVTNATAFNIASTETYTITGTDGNGCINTDVITITVNTNPTVTAASDVTNNEICGSGDVILTSVGNAVSYTWDNSVVEGVAFNTSATNTYTVTGVDAVGCENTASVTITVFTLPTVTATSDVANNTLCNSGDVTLTAGGNATSYAWDNSVVDGVAFNTSATNTYNVIGTDANGCENTASITITVNPLPTVTVTSDDADNTVCENATITLTAAGAATYAYTGAATDATPFAITATETFTVTGTDANGCVNTSNITITVNSLPTVTATSNDANNAICIGSSVIVNGNGASTYTYTGGISNGVSFSPTATNTYTVTGTDANGCVNTGTITITVNQLPVVDIAPYTEAVCDVVTNYSLTNVSPLTGVFSGANVTGTTFNPSAAGVGVHPITYTVTDINGCVGSDVENITVGDCSGIEENSSIVVSVYPNPTNGEFTLAINNANFSNITISIVDIHGKIVYNEMNVTIAQDYIKQINVSDLARGVYFVKLNNGSDISTKKLIIQ
jgi:hypothetical protein